MNRHAGQTDPERARSRRRGRPLRLPHDDHPFSSSHVDAAARIAWLVTTNRLLCNDPALHDRGELVERLTAQGIAADLSRVSRWESGQVPMSGRVLRGYEQALDLPHGSLYATARSVLRLAGAGAGEIDGSAYADVAEKSGRDLEVLLESAIDLRTGVAGGDWLELTTELSAFEHVFMPRAAWRLLCARLLRELARTSRADHLRRYEACVDVISHPQGQRHLIRALGEWLLHPDVQVTTPMMALLQEVDSPAASRLVMQLLGSSAQQVRDSAVRVAAAKADGGHFEPDDLVKLEAYGRLQLAATDSLRGLVDSLDLLTALPPDLLTRSTDAVRGARQAALTLAIDHRLLVPAATARTVASDVAGRAYAAAAGDLGNGPDRMLGRLVREALFHVHGPRRRAAAHLLAASPFDVAVADVVVDLTGHDDALVAMQAWELLAEVGHGSRSEELVDRALTEQRAELRAEALVCVGLGEGELPTIDQRAIVEFAGTVRDRREMAAAMFALGLRGVETLAAIDGEGSPLDPLAYWWQGVGPALQDDDSALASRRAS